MLSVSCNNPVSYLSSFESAHLTSLCCWLSCVLSFFTWYICTAQWPTTFTKFWAWSAKRGKLGARTCPRRRGFFVSITRRLFGNFATADFHQIWPWHVNRGWNADFWQKFMKSFHLGVICPQNAKLGGVKQAPHSEQATGQRMHCRVMLFTLRCISMAREFLSSGEFFCITYGSGATGQSKLPNFRILAYFPHTKRLKSTFRWPAYSPEVTLQNDSDFTVWQSASEVFLWLLLEELWTPKFLSMANGYTHTKCYYTVRQIWTKDVWKCGILRTGILSNQISLPLPPESPQNPILGDLLVQTLL